MLARTRGWRRTSLVELGRGMLGEVRRKLALATRRRVPTAATAVRVVAT